MLLGYYADAVLGRYVGEFAKPKVISVLNEGELYPIEKLQTTQKTIPTWTKMKAKQGVEKFKKGQMKPLSPTPIDIDAIANTRWTPMKAKASTKLNPWLIGGGVLGGTALVGLGGALL